MRSGDQVHFTESQKSLGLTCLDVKRSDDSTSPEPHLNLFMPQAGLTFQAHSLLTKFFSTISRATEIAILEKQDPIFSTLPICELNS